MIFDYEPGDYVINPKNKEWGTGQIQSIIKNIVTVNFEMKKKQTISPLLTAKVRQVAEWQPAAAKQ